VDSRLPLGSAHGDGCCAGSQACRPSSKPSAGPVRSGLAAAVAAVACCKPRRNLRIKHRGKRFRPGRQSAKARLLWPCSTTAGRPGHGIRFRSASAGGCSGGNWSREWATPARWACSEVPCLSLQAVVVGDPAAAGPRAAQIQHDQAASPCWRGLGRSSWKGGWSFRGPQLPFESHRCMMFSLTGGYQWFWTEVIQPWQAQRGCAWAGRFGANLARSDHHASGPARAAAKA